MKVKVIERYNDLVAEKIQEEGNVFEVSDERGKKLIKKGFVEEICDKPETVSFGRKEKWLKKEEPAAESEGTE